MYSSLSKIEFAIFNIPFYRRLQTLAVAFNFSLIWICIVSFLPFLIIPIFWPVTILYLLYIYKNKAHENGGWPSKWFRGLSFWNVFAEYFPVSIFSESALTPEKTYIFGYHPHGIYSTGAFVSFATEALHISKVFPGLKINILGLDLLFKVPIYRDIILAMGGASASKVSILNILNKGPGHACVIVIGGAQEALYTKPELSDLVLAKRFGFVKLAIQTGSSLVPIFGFGENMLFDQVPLKEGSVLKMLQDSVKKLFGFSFPLYYGRGVFNYTFGLMPRRHPVNVVVGKPIEVEKDENPTENKIKMVHKEYMAALEDLYERNKNTYFEEEEEVCPSLRFI